MIDPSPDSGAAASRGGASWRTLTTVLTSPREGFTALAERPTCALAIVLLIVIGVIGVWISMSKVTPADFLASIEASGREAPQKLRDNPEQALAMVRATNVAFAAVVGPVLYLLLGWIFLVVYRMFGSDINFRQSLATVVHGLLPFGIAGIVGIAIALGRTEISLQEMQSGGLVPSHLGVLAGEDSSKAMQALLGSVDLFSVWCIALLGIGYRAVARVGKGAAWGVVGTIWLAGVLVKVALASIF